MRRRPLALEATQSQAKETIPLKRTPKFAVRDGYSRLNFPCGRYRDRDSKLDARFQALREIMQMPE